MFDKEYGFLAFPAAKTGAAIAAIRKPQITILAILLMLLSSKRNQSVQLFQIIVAFVNREPAFIFRDVYDRVIVR